MLFYSCRARGHFSDPSSGQRLLHPRTSPCGRERSLIPDLQPHTGSPTAAVPTEEVSSFSKATAEASRCVFPLPPPAPSVRGESPSRQLPLRWLGRGSQGWMRPSPPHPDGIHARTSTLWNQHVPALGSHGSIPPQPLSGAAAAYSMGSFPGCPLAPGGGRWGEPCPGPQDLPLQRSHCEGHPQPRACPEGKSSSMTPCPFCPMSVEQQEPTPSLRGTIYIPTELESIPSHTMGSTELCPLRAVR